MTSIRINGQDKTRIISDWRIWYSSKNELLLTCEFPSGKSYTRPLSECEIKPSQTFKKTLIAKKGSAVFSRAESVTVYGNKEAVVRYSQNARPYIMAMRNIELIQETDMKAQRVFQYFMSVAQLRANRAKSKSAADIANNVVRQLSNLQSNPKTVLEAYCTGQNRRKENNAPLIFPFGINDSQLEAVANVFTSQVNLIEGPPGTGKTQTILNVLANILLRGETVAILSNNNTAVENVYEKLNGAGLDYLVAKLGNTDNRKAFFANPPRVPSGRLPPAQNLPQVEAKINHLKQFLKARNEEATLQADIDELNIERKHLLQWQREALETPLDPDHPTAYRLPPQKITDFMAYLALLGDQPVTLKHRFMLWLKFRIFRIRPLNTPAKRQELIQTLQLRYYENALREKEAALASCRAILESGNFQTLLEEVTTSSMNYLKGHLQKHRRPEGNFNADSYRKDFDAFITRYPIIGSSTHSIINSLKAGAVLDYAIIDEASQQDIVPGILPLACARNLIIVGDRKQLPPVFTQLDLTAPDERYDCDTTSLLDSCIQVFGDSIPVTLLKEHYRCHPKIIQFCNQQFYNNQLVPMTLDNGEDSLQLIVTAKGNHARHTRNQRELDSLLHVLEQGHSSQWDESASRGFIAPYNAQIDLSHSHLPASFIKDTTHKFQGRECDEIVFSTVLDKKVSNRRKLDFVDDPHLINVAVSRAKKRFTLVTGDGVFSAANGPVAALIRYIEYYADDAARIHRSPVVSAFDLLYREYDHSLEKLKSRLRARDSHYQSEQIVTQLLRERLSLPDYQSIRFHTQVALNQVVSPTHNTLTDQERGFMKGRSSCDFVLYFKVGKKPLAVIEVDGGSHGHPRQKAWDALKNSILAKAELPLLRLKTTESHIQGKTDHFLASLLK